MNDFIVYRKEFGPMDGMDAMAYLKGFRKGWPVFTTQPAEAKRVGLIGAIFYRLIFSYSIVPA